MVSIDCDESDSACTLPREEVSTFDLKNSSPMAAGFRSDTKADEHATISMHAASIVDVIKKEQALLFYLKSTVSLLRKN